MEERLAKAEADAETRVEERAKARRPISDGEGKREEVQAPDEKRTFRKLLQYGMDGLAPEERSIASNMMANVTPEMRAQSTTNTAGGYTIPQGFSGEIDKAMLMWGPMLDPGITRQINTDAGNLLPWPTMDDTSQTGALLSENAQAASQDITFGSVNLNAYMYTSKVILVSYQILQDSAFNLETEIIDPAFGERIGRAVNAHLTTGTGSSQPNGIMTAASLGTTTAAVAAVTADEIINFYHSLDPTYRMSPNFRMMFNDSTLLAIRKLKDGQNRYLIDGLKDNGATLNIAGISVPYSINQAVASMATGARFMAAGDFSRYVVRRVREYQMLRLVERYADYLQVGFIGFSRFDGNLLNTAAVKYMKNA
jgi:HK97 family phage major capsid protein